MSPLEIGATVFTLACVWLTVRQSLWCWPTGLVGCVLYAFVFHDAKLYSDALLQVVYVFLQLYGWHYWARGGDDGRAAPVRALGPARFSIWLAGALVGVLLLGGVMDTRTDADLPYWDATTTVLSLVAQWLMGRKLLESWVLWITVDVLSVGIYATKGLHLTSGLYAVFLVLASMGLLRWWREREALRTIAA